MLIDTKNYTVTGINGYRKANLTEDQAQQLAAKLDREMRVAGWRGSTTIYYRDGSVVEKKQ